MKKVSFLIVLLSSISIANAQLIIEWHKCLGGLDGDWAQSIQQTMDSGYIVAGYTLSDDSLVSGNHGFDEFWITKLNNAGNMEWNKCLGGSSYDEAYAIQQTSDSGYIVAGFSVSDDGDVSGNHGSDDFWVVKLSGTGNIVWQKSLGGTLMDDAYSIDQTSDGGYIVIGESQSNDGDATNNHGGSDYWIIKLDSNGNLLWQKSLGGSGDDVPNSIRQTSDGGFIVAGSTLSNDGDVNGNHGNWDYWIVKLNDTAAVEWQKCFGGTGQDICYKIQETTDSGYILTGFTKSNNGDVSGLHGTSQPDVWVVKLNNLGILEWQKCLGGTGDDKSYAIEQCNDGGYIVAGYAKSNNGDVSGNHAVGMHDYWLVKLNNTGSIEWQKCLGGTDSDWARSVKQTTDNGFIVAGWSSSYDGNVTGLHGNTAQPDFWIVKLNFDPTANSNIREPQWNLFPNPNNGVFTIQSDAVFDPEDLKIFNSTGQLIYQEKLTGHQTKIDLSNFSKGIYCITVIGKENNWVTKVVVE